MYILTEKNIPIDLNNIPVSELQNLNLNFCVFDLSNSDAIDYYFYPLIHMISFSSTTYLLSISGKYITIPSYYKILIGESFGDFLEFVDIEECMHRDFEVFMFNPLSSYKSFFAKLEIISILNDQKWIVPKIKNEHFLISPISKEKGSNCIFLSNNSCKIDSIDFGLLM